MEYKPLQDETENNMKGERSLLEKQSPCLNTHYPLQAYRRNGGKAPRILTSEMGDEWSDILRSFHSQEKSLKWAYTLDRRLVTSKSLHLLFEIQNKSVKTEWLLID